VIKTGHGVGAEITANKGEIMRKGTKLNR